MWIICLAASPLPQHTHKTEGHSLNVPGRLLWPSVTEFVLSHSWILFELHRPHLFSLLLCWTAFEGNTSYFANIPKNTFLLHCISRLTGSHSEIAFNSSWAVWRLSVHHYALRFNLIHLALDKEIPFEHCSRNVTWYEIRFSGSGR